MEVTEDQIEIARAISGLRSAIAAAGADPNDHTDYILRYAAHGRIDNNEAEHSAIAARLVGDTRQSDESRVKTVKDIVKGVSNTGQDKAGYDRQDHLLKMMRGAI